ncbi:acetyl/propionyl/methylcrotonyl-CoA carboxylase subunit alpha [Streptomyces rapamycinicus]|uniref:Acetyl/propionyl-CoA carboxylase, alpha subunit n=2 Tax=Streptomyces rapamycinicus TaxID=1226757 RepID=A0A0A0NIP2_STRRN|nr:biotin carboxylase N-terminal domain-containing protein [Streptomyces rapamycinicus]AGP57081.1 acetyl-CoA carboxylase subunit alpha [Streptomyces rapamycinicus NRRL 5491]MBB4784716.1 propionyl-CoA carboxylase alpha chain [Streptomyces rapamycinicus]RLV79806.1 acetyl/propionyl-CoA carboxylase, alpha subunit [Streptomyces rapamycinicus NRRL 5491]UTO64982.1 ATP-grasp domain-containing protein [Streptomyces rapamycinicus]UTP32938.1 ATP-grasp domain-containing protein [Streptomyces rapamycinicus
MIRSLLVANRAEIARRIVRTCRDLGIATVAVHSDADADAPHAREADAAVRLPGDAPADTYLRGDLLVKAALAAGADAVHPGYGFLSEHADFARAVRAAGLVWVGPPPEAMEAMASKTRAKEIMRKAGVPLLDPLDPAEVTAGDLPVLVKAAAGGGGRGMRVVRELAALPAELDSARAEAASAFGDGEIFVEPYMEGARHVEVQVLADNHGTVWTLGTRDCSLQRRHQKVIEEAPAPGLEEELRRTLGESAANAARAIGYEGAGTVEFLVSPSGRAYFLEMNTRLQVEHPVTEEIHGLDLVALQLRIAEGERLDAEPPAPRGHAVEARLYAEDPARGWRPQTGILHRLEVPGLRVDSGPDGGDAIGVHYDPMLAKVIAVAPTRAEAVRRLAHGLERARIHGPVTNRELLVRALRHPEFEAGRMDTGFLERHLPELTAEASENGEAVPLAALAAALADAARRPATVAGRLGGWRNVPSQPQLRSYRAEPGGTEHEVGYRLTRDGLLAEGLPDVRLLTVEPGWAADPGRDTQSGRAADPGRAVQPGRDADPARVVLDVAGVRRTFEVTAYGDRRYVDTPQGGHVFTALPRFPDPTARTEPGSLLAPMPGTVVRIAEVAVGDRVEAGQSLLWLEAMKMEHRVTAPAAGVLTALHAAPGRQVEVGALLAVVAAGE